MSLRISPRKQLIMKLTELEKQLVSQQTQVNKHKRYFLSRLHDSHLMVPAILLPAFLIGFRCARIKQPARFLKPIGKFLLPVMLTHIIPN